MAGQGPFAAPVNTFRHVRMVFNAKLARELGIVSPNNDTLYSIAHADVGPEPLVLRVPEVRDRYYVRQFLDPWTNNFAYVGQRTTDGQAGQFLLVAPGWNGEPPDGMPVIHAPTRLFIIGGRFLVNARPTSPTSLGCRTAWPCSRCRAIRSRPTWPPAGRVTGRCPNPTPGCPRRWGSGSGCVPSARPGHPTPTTRRHHRHP